MFIIRNIERDMSNLKVPINDQIFLLLLTMGNLCVIGS